MDLNVFITKNQCECLNEADDHPLVHAFTSGGGYLQSDCDEQLILSVTFNQAVKIHSIKLKAPEKIGPKNLKLFINQPRTIDFDQAEACIAVQDIAYVYHLSMSLQNNNFISSFDVYFFVNILVLIQKIWRVIQSICVM